MMIKTDSFQVGSTNNSRASPTNYDSLRTYLAFVIAFLLGGGIAAAFTAGVYSSGITSKSCQKDTNHICKSTIHIVDSYLLTAFGEGDIAGAKAYTVNNTNFTFSWSSTTPGLEKYGFEKKFRGAHALDEFFGTVLPTVTDFSFAAVSPSTTPQSPFDGIVTLGSRCNVDGARDVVVKTWKEHSTVLRTGNLVDNAVNVAVYTFDETSKLIETIAVYVETPEYISAYEPSNLDACQNQLDVIDNYFLQAFAYGSISNAMKYTVNDASFTFEWMGSTQYLRKYGFNHTYTGPDALTQFFSGGPTTVKNFTFGTVPGSSVVPQSPFTGIETAAARCGGTANATVVKQWYEHSKVKRNGAIVDNAANFVLYTFNGPGTLIQSVQVYVDVDVYIDAFMG